MKKSLPTIIVGLALSLSTFGAATTPPVPPRPAVAPAKAKSLDQQINELRAQVAQQNLRIAKLEAASHRVSGAKPALTAPKPAVSKP